MKIMVKVGDRTFEVEVGDLRTRPIQAIIDGRVFEVWPEDHHAPAAAVSQAPAPVSAPVPTVQHSNHQTGSSTVAAPIPGVIVEVAVQPGTTVQAGQALCTLETMKMKNLIRAPRDGRIRAVHVTVGQHVKHRDALMEYEV